MTKFRSDKPMWLLAGLMAIYLVLVLPAVPVHGIANDELTDLLISNAYRDEPLGWLTGSDRDLSQARLPMYATATLSAALGRPSLKASRVLSCLYGLLTLLGVFWFCRRELDDTKGLLAVAILAVSPYFLAFSKAAMTEGDSLVACTGIWLANATLALARHGNLGSAMLVALMGGLAVSAKVSSSAWLPAVLVSYLVLRRPALQDTAAGGIGSILLTLMTGLAVVILGWWWATSDIPDSDYAKLPLPLDYGYSVLPPSVKLAHATMVIASLGTFVFLSFRGWHRRVTWWQATLITGLGAALTFFAIPPTHTTNPGIVESLLKMVIDTSSASTSQGQAAYAAGVSSVGMLSAPVLSPRVYSAAVFHPLVVLLKSGLLVGIVFWIAFGLALVRVRHRRVLAVPVLFITSYTLFLVQMGHAQTFHMIGVLPFFAILAADGVVKLTRRNRIAGAVVLLAMAGNTAADLVRSYPDMHLNGYQWTGERYIAYRATLGYKGLAQTPSDGTEQITAWARANIKPGERVHTYLRPQFRIYFLGPEPGVPFIVRDGFDPRRDLGEANYVLIHINALIRQFDTSATPPASVYNYPFDEAELRRDFRKVFSVKRAFGIEVASIWYRKKPHNFDLHGNVKR